MLASSSGAPVAAHLNDEPLITTRFYASTIGDPQAIADTLTATMPERGVSATTFLAEADLELAGQDSFLTILQAYLGIGLMIGIVGLGVVLTRAVRERRRELGMLRAMGIPISQIRGMFVVEAAFIGLQGGARYWPRHTQRLASVDQVGGIRIGTRLRCPWCRAGADWERVTRARHSGGSGAGDESGRESPAAALRFAA
ncbi:MAG: ABC transporter permease [Acidimicrobiales bacterium]